MLRRFLFSVLLVLTSCFAVAQNDGIPDHLVTRELQLPLAAPPQMVSSANVANIGNPGPRALFYWIVSDAGSGSSSVAGPFTLASGPNTLSASTGVKISWAPALGAASYDVLRTSSNAPPQGACNCAVSVGATTTSVNDTSESLSAYTITTINPANYLLRLRNDSTAVGAANLGLYQGNTKIGNVGVINTTAACDGVTNDTAAFQAALASCANSGLNVVVPMSGAGCKISSTLVVPSMCGLVAQDNGGGATYGGPILFFGPKLVWAGADNSTMVKLFDATFSTLRGVNMDCGSAANMEGVVITGDNSPPTTMNNVHDFAVKNCHHAITLGDTSNTPNLTCAGNVNQVGCYEADGTNIDNILVYGKNTDLTGEAVHVNSANAGQQMTISRIRGGSVNKGIHIVNTNGGLKLEHNTIGSPVGASPAMIQVDAQAASPIMSNNECEGAGWAYGILDHATAAGSTTPPVSWNNNQIYCPVLVDGTTLYHTDSNNGLTATWVAGGNTIVYSTNDIRIWGTPTGNAQVEYQWIGRRRFRGPVAIGGNYSGDASNDLDLFATLEMFSSSLIGSNQRGVIIENNYDASADVADIVSMPQIKPGAHVPSVTNIIAATPTLGAGGSVDDWTGMACQGTPNAGVTNECFHNFTTAPMYLGPAVASSYASLTDCASKTSPAVCAASPDGSVVIAAATTSVVVNTSAVGANSEILLTRDDGLGTKLSATCNTQSSLVLGSPRVTARSAGVSFTVSIDVGPTTNPMCISYKIEN